MVIHIRQHVFRQPPPEFAPKRLFISLAGIAADDLLCRSLIEAAALRHRLTRLDCALDFAQLNSIALLFIALLTKAVTPLQQVYNRHRR